MRKATRQEKKRLAQLDRTNQLKAIGLVSDEKGVLKVCRPPAARRVLTTRRVFYNVHCTHTTGAEWHAAEVRPRRHRCERRGSRTRVRHLQRGLQAAADKSECSLSLSFQFIYFYTRNSRLQVTLWKI